MIWDKTTYEELEVGDGLPLSVGHVPAFLSTDPEVPARFTTWRNEVYSAAGLVASVLDDRVAQREVFDDFVIIDDGRPVTYADSRLRVRNFLPFDLTDADEVALASLADADIGAAARAAAPWYLRAAQMGPAADGIVFFWIALEALVKAEGRRVVARVEDALRELGEDPTLFDPALGPLWGIRARIVHFGESEPEDTEQMVDGWYVLETVCRKLLRARGGIESTWPESPGDESALPESVRSRWAAAQPRTVWHEREE